MLPLYIFFTKLNDDLFQVLTDSFMTFHAWSGINLSVGSFGKSCGALLLHFASLWVQLRHCLHLISNKLSSVFFFSLSAVPYVGKSDQLFKCFVQWSQVSYVGRCIWMDDIFCFYFADPKLGRVSIVYTS